MSRETCTEHLPLRDDVIMERLIGVKDSYFKYGTKTLMQMFSYKNIFSSSSSKGTSSDEENNRERIHPKSK